MNMSIKHSAVASGIGRLTGADLVEVGKSIPGEAVVDITKHSDQRDGDSWVIEAVWDAVAEANKSGPQFHHTYNP